MNRRNDGRADSMSGLYGDVDMTRVMFGQHAVHVPAWLIVQDQGEGLVTFVGSSRLPVTNHPLRYGLTGLAGDVWRGFDEGERLV
jgi:hypothetical protein